MFAVIAGNPDGIHHVSLWTVRERADKHAAGKKAKVSKSSCEWVEVKEVSVLDDGADITNVWE
jgi:hypothetical protein